MRVSSQAGGVRSSASISGKHGFEVLEATNQAIAIVGKNGS
jgi:hypothetical protein